MRFRITRHVCVEVDSVDELVEFEGSTHDALVEVVGDAHVNDEVGAEGGGSLDGMDEESTAALNRYAAEHGWDD